MEFRLHCHHYADYTRLLSVDEWMDGCHPIYSYKGAGDYGWMVKAEPTETIKDGSSMVGWRGIQS